MRKYLLILLATFITYLSYAQDAEALNKQSKELIDQKRFKEAYPILLKAAELNHSEAQYNLGYLSGSGALGESNMTEAIRWYKKSSENGLNDGHYAMMMAYGNGQGVEQNLKLALIYALKGAENNDPTCTWNVINCYMTGIGTEADTAKAIEWMVKLARIPNPENLAQSGYITSARLNLAQSYQLGDYNLKKDLYQSYLWYLIYNESKVDFSVFMQDEMIKEIRLLEKKLTQDQLASAREDAERLLGRKLNNLGELYENSLEVRTFDTTQ